MGESEETIHLESKNLPEACPQGKSRLERALDFVISDEEGSLAEVGIVADLESWPEL